MSIIKAILDEIECFPCRDKNTDERKNAIIIGAIAFGAVMLFFLLCSYQLFIRPDGLNNTSQFLRTLVQS